MLLKTPPVKSRAVEMYPDGRLDGKNASAYLGLTEKTLAMHRAGGTGPRFIKRGRIFYYKEDLDQWLNEKGRHRSTAQAVQPLSSQEKAPKNSRSSLVKK